MTALDALAEKDRALSEVEIAKRRVIDAGLDVLREWAAKGRPFSANDARAQLREVGVEASTAGALYNAAIKAGLIRPIGEEPSTDLSTHHKAVQMYVGAAELVTASRTCAAPGCVKSRDRRYRHCRMHVDRLQRFGSLEAPELAFGSMLVDDVELRPVPGVPVYAAGSDGHIYSVGRRWRTGRPRRLAESANPRSGYMQVEIRIDGRQATLPVHRLVATAWLGEKPEGEVRRHLNGNKADNRPVNLAYGTHQDNSDDMEAHGTRVRGERQGRATVSDKQIAEAFEMFAAGATDRQVAERFGVWPETAANWRRGNFRGRRADGSVIPRPETITVPAHRTPTGRFTAPAEESAGALFEIGEGHS